MEESVGSKQYKCSSCQKEFSNLQVLYRHKTVCNPDNQSSACPRCGKPNEGTHYSCPECDRCFSYLKLLENHQLKHITDAAKGPRDAGASSVDKWISLSEDEFKCDFCEKVFDTLDEVEVHVKSHAGDKPFECDICGKSFSYRANMKSHRLTHLKTKKVKRFQCNICDSVFSYRTQIEAHAITHTGIKPFDCDICGKLFSYKRNMKAHRILFHPSVEVGRTVDPDLSSCTSNSYTIYYEEVNAEAYVRKTRKESYPTHSSESTDKMFTCQRCKTKFSDLTNFLWHKRMDSCSQQQSESTSSQDEPSSADVVETSHLFLPMFPDDSTDGQDDSEEQDALSTSHTDYTCFICGIEFKNKFALRGHQRMHSAAEQYPCSCGKKFSYYSSMVKHERKHSNLQRYSCTDCGVFYLDAERFQMASINQPHVKSCVTLPKTYDPVYLSVQHIQKTFTTKTFHPGKLHLHAQEFALMNPFVFIDCSPCCVIMSEVLQDESEQQYSDNGMVANPSLTSHDLKNVVADNCSLLNEHTDTSWSESQTLDNDTKINAPILIGNYLIKPTTDPGADPGNTPAELQNTIKSEYVGSYYRSSDCPPTSNSSDSSVGPSSDNLKQDSNQFISQSSTKKLRLKCKYCIQNLHSLSELGRHERLHTGQEGYGKKFKPSQMSTRKLRLKCKYCIQNLHSLSELRTHEQSHTVETGPIRKKFKAATSSHKASANMSMSKSQYSQLNDLGTVETGPIRKKVKVGSTKHKTSENTSIDKGQYSVGKSAVQSHTPPGIVEEQISLMEGGKSEVDQQILAENPNVTEQQISPALHQIVQTQPQMVSQQNQIQPEKEMLPIAQQMSQEQQQISLEHQPTEGGDQLMPHPISSKQDLVYAEHQIPEGQQQMLKLNHDILHGHQQMQQAQQHMWQAEQEMMRGHHLMQQAEQNIQHLEQEIHLPQELDVTQISQKQQFMQCAHQSMLHGQLQMPPVNMQFGHQQMVSSSYTMQHNKHPIPQIQMTDPRIEQEAHHILQAQPRVSYPQDEFLQSYPRMLPSLSQPPPSTDSTCSTSDAPSGTQHTTSSRPNTSE